VSFPSKRNVVVFIVVIIVICLFVYLAIQYPEVLHNQDNQIRLVHATLLLSIFLIPSIFYSKINSSQALKSAAIWLGLGFVLFVGYAYRDEASSVFGRLTGELIPNSAQNVGQTAVIRKGQDGHFSVDALVDGQRIRFLIDTGASDVVLSPLDAKRLGFNLERLRYSKTYRTANGSVKGAPVILGQITIGSIQLSNVPASVNGADMNRSLLGMRFLNQLSRFEISGNQLILTP